MPDDGVEEGRVVVSLEEFGRCQSCEDAPFGQGGNHDRDCDARRAAYDACIAAVADNYRGTPVNPRAVADVVTNAVIGAYLRSMATPADPDACKHDPFWVWEDSVHGCYRCRKCRKWMPEYEPERKRGNNPRPLGGPR